MYFKDNVEAIAFVPHKKNKIKALMVVEKETISKDLVLRVELMKKKKDIYRPYKIWYKERGRQNFVDYKEFFNLLRGTKILIPRAHEKELKNVIKMLKDFQLTYEVVEICRFCLNINKLTILEDNSYLFYDEFICKSCALKEIKNELNYINFNPTTQYLDNLNELLDKFRNTNHILNFLKPGFIAAKHEEFTLYDTLETRKKRDIPIFDIDDLNLPKEFVDILKKLKIKFLPVQNLAISQGLLENQDLLIVAPTSTGKTLCGELAGIPKALKGKKMIYLSPLVALTNTKYEEFKNKYGKILNVAIRVGMSKIDVGEEDLVILDSAIQGKDIICASYEAFDYLIRKSEYGNIKDVGTIIVDEIQTLDDIERGIELSGLFSRLKIIYPDAQIIGLSATIANAKEIGSELGLKPLIYKSRPVPVERHLVLCKSKVEKRLNLSYLVKKERKFGSTIVFTNSRYGTYQLSQYLKKQNLNLPAYHSGLSYYARKIIEKEIEFNQIDGVVSTFALGAGVDLPVSQVIFHSMRMGRDYLDNNMFLQMSGRAGRYKRHKRGKVVILAAVGKKFYGSDKTEDQIALQLLEGKEQNIITDYDPILVESQVLASMASGMNLMETEKFYDLLIGAEEDFNYLLEELVKKNMIQKNNNNGTFEITNFGSATAISFFTTEQALEIKKKLHKNVSILDIAIALEFFNNIYLDNRLKEELSRLLKVNLSSLFFTGSVFDLFSNLEKITGKIPDRVIETIITWQKNFSCDHDERPYCDCGLLKANFEIADLRMSGFKPSQISNHFKRKYDLIIYPGDIFKMLDSLIHRLRGIRRIASSLELEEDSKKAQKLIRKIENP